MRLKSKQETNETDLSIMGENTESLLRYEAIKLKIINQELKITKVKGRSKVWQFYGKIEDKDGIVIPNLVACRKCFTINRYNLRSTSNLVRHKCYVKSVTEIEETPEVDVEADTKKEGMIVFIQWILLQCRPLYILQDAGLMKVVEFLIAVGAKYGNNVGIQRVLPQPTTIARNIESIYGTHVEKLKSQLVSIKNIGFGLTADIWTDNYLRKNYIAVTMHYILNGTLFCRLLGTRSIKGEKCTHDQVAMKVSNLLQEFNCEFDDKAVMVIDGGRNMVDAFRDKNRINCVNHLLYKTMQKSMEEVNYVAELCNVSTNLVKYFKILGQTACPQFTLKSFTPTRWNTFFYLFTSISEYWGEINKVLHENNQLHRIIQIDINLVNDIIKVLEPFEETFKKLEAATYPTIHSTFLYIYRLKNKCSVLPQDTHIIKMFKETLHNYLDSIVIENLSIYHKLAIFLFPPTNKLNNFNEIEKNNIKQKCIDLMKSYLPEDSCNRILNDTTGLSTLERELLESFGQQSEIATPEDKISKEMQTYTNLSISFLNELELIQWWESHKTELPLLYKVSCRVLAIPATSSASERTFSVAGWMLSEKCPSMAYSDSLSNEIMFLHSNLNEKEITINLQNVSL